LLLRGGEKCGDIRCSEATRKRKERTSIFTSTFRREKKKGEDSGRRGVEIRVIQSFASTQVREKKREEEGAPLPVPTHSLREKGRGANGLGERRGGVSRPLTLCPRHLCYSGQKKKKGRKTSSFSFPLTEEKKGEKNHRSTAEKRSFSSILRVSLFLEEEKKKTRNRQRILVQQ